MAYKHKTYVTFDAGTDITQYRLMTAWKANEGIDFDFFDAHDINNLWSGSGEATIKTKLRERLRNTKQMVVLVGENTKNLFKFVRWEMEVAIDMDIPIIAANLDQENSSTAKTPAILKNEACFMNVPFGPKSIKYALDNFPAYYHKNKHNGSAALHYNWSKITL
jgi:hypothetical protein